MIEAAHSNPDRGHPPATDLGGEVRERAVSSGRIVTARAIAIACALMPVLALWVVNAEIIWYTGHSTAISLFYHVTFTLLVLALIDLGIRQYFPGVELTSSKLMTIYVMLSVAGIPVYHFWGG